MTEVFTWSHKPSIGQYDLGQYDFGQYDLRRYSLDDMTSEGRYKCTKDSK